MNGMTGRVIWHEMHSKGLIAFTCFNYLDDLFDAPATFIFRNSICLSCLCSQCSQSFQLGAPESAAVQTCHITWNPGMCLWLMSEKPCHVHYLPTDAGFQISLASWQQLSTANNPWWLMVKSRVIPTGSMGILVQQVWNKWEPLSTNQSSRIPGFRRNST